MSTELVQGDAVFERAGMARVQDHGRRATCEQRLLPPRRAVTAPHHTLNWQRIAAGKRREMEHTKYTTGRHLSTRETQTWAAG